MMSGDQSASPAATTVPKIIRILSSGICEIFEMMEFDFRLASLISFLTSANFRMTEVFLGLYDNNAWRTIVSELAVLPTL